MRRGNRICRNTRSVAFNHAASATQCRDLYYMWHLLERAGVDAGETQSICNRLQQQGFDFGGAVNGQAPLAAFRANPHSNLVSRPVDKIQHAVVGCQHAEAASSQRTSKRL
jgi:hypothetical protein